MKTRRQTVVRKALLLGGSLALWLLFMFPYCHYNYWPGEYPRGPVAWEVSRQVETYTVPDHWRWLVADVGGNYFAAEGFVPCWNTLDKEVMWPGMLAAAFLIIAACGAGFWVTRDRRGRPLEASPYHTWDAAPEGDPLAPAPRSPA
ncbi:MAG: hypothetical protein IT368_07400 [Candidatus Hydrogenedentes bacterium]|nr:hypothetical protein [Candidatus Hydrogenedentota bacterium]